MTLTGPGGCGKTRLALEVCQRLLKEDSWQGVICFVPLAALLDARFMPDAIDRALRLPHLPNLAVFDQILQALSQYQKPIVLVLDNMEHLLPEALPLIQNLLTRVPQLQLLVTSRQALRVTNERLFEVPLLATPHDDVPLDELLQYESVQMFGDRMQTVQPRFRITKRNAAILVKLCARLEGVPLAIELCASHGSTLSPSQMLAGVQHRLDFGVEQPAATYPHTTLRAALEWSFDLLWPDLQRFFTALSVFRGSFTSEAAEVVCEEPHGAHFLEQLRTRSLLFTQNSGDNRRFYWLESLREVAHEKLAAHEYWLLQQRHAAFYCALAETAQPGLQGPEQSRWLNQLEAEQDNFRAALAWLIDNEPMKGLQLACTLGRFWLTRGYYSEGLNWIELALQKDEVMHITGHSPHRMLQVKALGAAADLAWHSGEFALSFSLNQQRLGFARELNDVGSIAAALSALAYAAAQQGDFPAARPLFDESLALSRNAADESLRVDVLLRAAVEASACAEFERCRSLGEEALILACRLGDQCAIASLLKTLGFAACLEGNLERSRPLLEESLTLFEHVGEKLHTNMTWWTLGHLARREGNFPVARAHFHHALEELRDWGYGWPVAYNLEPLAYIEINEKRFERAAQLLGAAHALRESAASCLAPRFAP